jgi:hypothetical protein
MYQRIYQSWLVFDKYYTLTDQTPIYAAALLLHPNLRIRYIQRTWKKQWQQDALKSVRRLWELYRDKVPLLHQLVASYDEKVSQPADDYDQIYQEILDNLPRPASANELEDFIKEEPSSIVQPETALSWWLKEEQRRRWPQLSYMAIDILSIPAMSAEPERIFSGARRTISWERSQLSTNTIEQTECLKHWKMSGILDSEL